MVAFFLNPEPHKRLTPGTGAVKDFVRPVDVPDDLQAFYDLLDCSLIDIAMRKCFGFKLNFVVDDEGLFKEPCHPSVVFYPDGLDGEHSEVFVGRVLVFGPDDGQGNLTEIPPAVFPKLVDSIYSVTNREGKEQFVLRLPVSYR